jgi:hypothetical protein
VLISERLAPGDRRSSIVVGLMLSTRGRRVFPIEPPACSAPDGDSGSAAYEAIVRATSRLE